MLNKIIKRPVLATVVSIIITMLGILGLMKIPLTQYPDIAPPTVYVYGNYPGGNAQSVIRSVITPLEEAINGVENMQYMTSSAANDGSFAITIVFNQDVDPDQAAVNVQNRVAQANAQLPQEVIRLGVNTTKQQTSSLMMLNVTSSLPEKYDEAFIQNYVKINLIPELKRISGVGNVQVYGMKDYAIRVWLDPVKLSSYGLVPTDVEQAIVNNSFESSPGKLGEESDAPLQYVLRYKGKINTPHGFENIIVKNNASGGIIRLGDVSKIEFGNSSYGSNTLTNGNPSTIFSIIQSSGSNANEIAIAVQESLDQFEKNLPEGLEYNIIMNVKDKLDASISQMQKTLLEAFIFVFIVVFIFLQDFRSTIIPAIAVPVSIIGTIFFMYLIGFSINVLTLFALVLAIGIVVDDAIVVVEAVHAKMAETGENARKATQSAMSEISGAIISITLVMSAVFLPVGFMDGPAGVFYRQFSYTLAIAILISAVNALTLSPALCALLLKPHQQDGEHKKNFTQRFGEAFNTSFDRITNKYVKAVSFLGKRKLIALGALLVLSGTAFYLMNNSQKGFVPEEDDSMLNYMITLQAGTNLQHADKEVEVVNNILKEREDIIEVNSITGLNIFTFSQASNSIFGFIRLKKPDERADINTIMEEIQAEVKNKIKGEFTMFRNPAIEGFGSAGGVELILQDRTSGDLTQFGKVGSKVMEKLQARPEIAYAFTTFRSDYPQYEVILDEDKALQLGLTPKEVMDAMQTYLSGNQIIDFVRFGKIFRVNVKSDAEFRKDENALANFYIKNKQEQMIPLSNLVKLEKVLGPESIARFNLFNNISVNIAPNPGYSSGAVMSAVDEVLKEDLPKGYSYEFSGLGRQEQKSGSQMIFIFAISILFVYFLLAAQYESYLLPLAVLFSLPLGILGVFLATKFAGIDNNIYVQIALIMLVGLLAKNAILIIEFAIQSRKNGASIFDAALTGARQRLRPILMTSFAFIAGLVPLMFASGSTAIGNISISVSAAGGMLIGTVLGLFLIPVLFIVFQTLQEKVSTKLNVDQDEE